MELKQKYIVGVFTILILFIFLAPFADPNPDGLESAAGEHAAPEGSAFDLGFLTDYGSENSLLFHLLRNEFLAITVSGLIGVVIVVGLFFIPLAIIRRRRSNITPNK
ncbi:MAG: PDGLE domain-containing protein [Candidatus Hodarchaeota archaeon]